MSSPLSSNPGSDDLDLTRALGAFDPVVAPPVLPESDVSYVVEDTPIGRMLLARTEAGALVASAFLRPDATEEAWLQRLARAVSPRVLRRPAALDEARRELAAYLAGERRAFDLRVDLALATPFQRVVLTGLRESVGYGERTTYGALARRVGRPSASRAVGAALGANPLCVVLPCHRVVASSGALTGYAGGLPAKERLLALESG
jgi:methylated-DNA-[protein]-cysteine S-methyltransferase